MSGGLNLRQRLHLRRSPQPIASPPARTLALCLLIIYYIAFFCVLQLLNSSVEHLARPVSQTMQPYWWAELRWDEIGAIAILLTTSISAFLGSIWITKNVYDTFDKSFSSGNGMEK